MIRIKDRNEEREDPDVDIFNINQNVQDTVIHLEVDEAIQRTVLGVGVRELRKIFFHILFHNQNPKFGPSYSSSSSSSKKSSLRETQKSKND